VGLAHAGEAVPHWEPGLEGLGRWGLVSGDFDADGLEDLAATVESADGVSEVVVLYGGATEPATYTLPTAQPVASLGSGDLDGDGVHELLVGLPANDGATGDDSGLLVVLSLTALPGETVSGADAALAIVSGAEESGHLGTAAAIADLDGDGDAELLVTAPGENGSGAVWVFSHDVHGTVDNRTAAGGWAHFTKQTGLGTGVAVYSGAVGTTVAMASCSGFEPVSAACAGGGDLLGVDGAAWEGLETLRDTLDVTTYTDPPQTFFHAAPTGTDLLFHGSTALVQAHDPTAEPAETLRIRRTKGSTGLALIDDATGDTLPDLLVQDGDAVLVIGDFTASGAAADFALDSFAVTGVSLGARLATSGDLDGDGCADALASAPDEGAIYLLQGSCTSETDTGDTGEPQDTADTGDTGDTGDTSDTGDTGECQAEFGWTCASARARPAWFAPLVLLLLSRRRHGSRGDGPVGRAPDDPAIGGWRCAAPRHPAPRTTSSLSVSRRRRAAGPRGLGQRQKRPRSW